MPQVGCYDPTFAAPAGSEPSGRNWRAACLLMGRIAATPGCRDKHRTGPVYRSRARRASPDWV